jgi:predicted peptidase
MMVAGEITVTTLLLFSLLGGAQELPQNPGVHQERFETKEGLTVRYTLSIPKGYEPGRPSPLVLALHYGGRVTPYYSKGFLLELVKPGLVKLDAIIVAPDCPSPNGWNNPESDKAVTALLHHILKNYEIDRSRLLVTGYSMGGHGTWYMAAEHPELFTAAIPMAGAPQSGTLEKIDDMPICVVHSDADRVVPIQPSRDAVKEMEGKNATVKLIVARGAEHYHFGSFVEPLKRAADWIEKQWRN